MATTTTTPSISLEAFPEQIIRHVISVLNLDDASDVQFHHAVGGHNGNRHLYQIYDAYNTSHFLDVLLATGIQKSHQRWTLSTTLPKLGAIAASLTTLSLGVTRTPAPPAPGVEKYSLGREISRCGMYFHSLHKLELDQWCTGGLDLIRCLAECAPNLHTLIANLSYPNGANFAHAALLRIQQLQIAYTDQQESFLATGGLLALCPNVRSVTLLRLYTGSVGGPEVMRSTRHLLRALRMANPLQLEWDLNLSTFAFCVVEENIRLGDLRDIWLRCTSWDVVAYETPCPLQGSWPSLRMTPTLAKCLRNLPRLRSVNSESSLMSPGAQPSPQAYISSYINSSGKGELSHATILVEGEWEDVTDYMGEVVPFDIIDRMRAAEGCTDDIWAGAQPGRRIVVGNDTWNILTEWYASGPKATQHPTPPGAGTEADADALDSSPSEPIIDRVVALPTNMVHGIEKSLNPGPAIFVVVQLTILIVCSMLPILP